MLATDMKGDGSDNEKGEKDASTDVSNLNMYPRPHRQCYSFREWFFQLVTPPRVWNGLSSLSLPVCLQDLQCGALLSIASAENGIMPSRMAEDRDEER